MHGLPWPSVLPQLLSSILVLELQDLASNDWRSRKFGKRFASVKSTSGELVDKKAFELVNILRI